MQTVGIVLILCGAYLIYETLHSRMGSSQGSASSSSDGGGSVGGSGSRANPDSGHHEGIGIDGAQYTIDKPYGDMTDQEKDDANRYAHNIGNVAGV